VSPSSRSERSSCCAVLASLSRRARAAALLPILVIAAVLTTTFAACSKPAAPHRLVGSWEYSVERTRVLSRDAAQQFTTPDLGAMRLSIGADGTFAFEGETLSARVPSASRWELVRESGDRVTIRVTRPDKPTPETIDYTFSGNDELRVDGERVLVFRRVN